MLFGSLFHHPELRDLPRAWPSRCILTVVLDPGNLQASQIARSVSGTDARPKTPLFLKDKGIMCVSPVQNRCRHLSSQTSSCSPKSTHAPDLLAQLTRYSE